MGTTAEKLTYLNGTKRLLRRRLNSLGANITLDTKFRDYLVWLDRFYKAASAPLKFEILGETTQKAVNTSTNILYLPDDEVVENGVTVTISEGGKFTINGTPTSDMWVKLTNGMDVVYEEPPTMQPVVYNNHPWASDTLLEYDEAKSLYLTPAWGGGTKSNISDYVGLIFVFSEIDSYWNTQSQQGLINLVPTSSSFEKKIRITSSSQVKKFNCVYIYLKANVAYNMYAYLEISETRETTWTPNYDALPPSPDNPKEIINKTGEITYTASDGTIFPIDLGNIELCYNPGVNYDCIVFENGVFHLRKITYQYTFDEENRDWSHQSQYNGLYYTIFYAANNYALSNYYENVRNSNIVDIASADSNLSNGQFAIGTTGNARYIFVKNTNLTETGNDVTQFLNWLSTHNLTVQYQDSSGIYMEEINKYTYPELYSQLQAIVDYETKLIIEKKIGG